MTQGSDQALFVNGTNLVALHHAVLAQPAFAFWNGNIDQIRFGNVLSAGYRGHDHDGGEAVADVVLDEHAGPRFVGFAANHRIKVDLDYGTPYALARHRLRQFRIDVRKSLRGLASQASIGHVALGQLLFEFLPLPSVRPVNLETHELGLDLAERYRMPIYDALIAAAALRAKCKVLYSEDFRHNQRIQQLTIRNPFIG